MKKEVVGKHLKRLSFFVKFCLTFSILDYNKNICDILLQEKRSEKHVTTNKSNFRNYDWFFII